MQITWKREYIQMKNKGQIVIYILTIILECLTILLTNVFIVKACMLMAMICFVILVTRTILNNKKGEANEKINLD